MRDLSIVTSILRSKTFPPKETWFSGWTVNIYYFGHFVVANLIKLSGVEAGFGFRLAPSTFLALILISAFGLIYNLTLKINYSILAGLFTALMGNIDGLMQIIFNPLLDFDWWQSAHIIPYTYQEFPFWSFSFGESHPFFMVHIFVLLFLYCSLNLIKSKNIVSYSRDLFCFEKIISIIIFSLSIGALAVTNTWNYPPAVMITAGIVFYYFYIKKRLSKKTLINSVLLLLLIVFLSIFLYLPFYLNYKAPFSGFRLVPEELRTTSLQFLVTIGAFLLPLMSYLFIKIRKSIGKEKEYKFYYALILPLFILGLFSRSFVLIFSFILGIIVFYLFIKEKNPEESFLLLIIGTVTTLFLVSEIICLRDVFGGEYIRYNTLSKLYIQTQLLLPILSVYCIYYFNKHFKGLEVKWIINVLIIVPIVSSFIFPVLGTYVVSNKFQKNQYFSEIEVMRVIYPQKYEAIIWLQKNIKGQSIILEAPGESYDYQSGQISTFTGLPTLVEWPQHLATWMGESAYSFINKRLKDIQEIYNNPDKGSIYPLIQKYKIEYIFVGPEERSLYDYMGLNGFDSFELWKVFENSKVKIYKTNLTQTE
jgi:YYY domain-containing protein